MNYFEIPIYIICHNNGFMVKDMVIDLKSKFLNPIVIIDNASDSKITIDILKELEQIKNVKIKPKEVLTLF